MMNIVLHAHEIFFLYCMLTHTITIIFPSKIYKKISFSLPFCMYPSMSWRQVKTQQYPIYNLIVTYMIYCARMFYFTQYIFYACSQAVWECFTYNIQYHMMQNTQGLVKKKKNSHTCTVISPGWFTSLADASFFYTLEISTSKSTCIEG